MLQDVFADAVIEYMWRYLSAWFIPGFLSVGADMK